MKNQFKYLTVMAIMAIALSSCYTSSEKVDNAEADVIDAEAALIAANKAYEEDMANYRSETAIRIAENERSMADFKARIADEKQEARAEYLLKVAELEQKNTDMKKRMDEYRADGKDNWTRFKDEFNKDMDDLGAALKDITTKKD